MGYDGARTVYFFLISNFKKKLTDCIGERTLKIRSRNNLKSGRIWNYHKVYDFLEGNKSLTFALTSLFGAFLENMNLRTLHQWRFHNWAWNLKRVATFKQQLLPIFYSLPESDSCLLRIICPVCICLFFCTLSATELITCG